VKLAVMSDVHANPKALETALADARGQGCERFVMLGDVTGYGYDSPKDRNKNLKRIIEKNIVCTDMFEWDYDNWRPKVRPKQLSLL
jgi:predicted phosphodiesterase